MAFGGTLVGIGDPGVMVPAAVAISGWLVAAGVPRAALSWILLFTSGVAIVVATKLAFLAWGVGIPIVNLKAISGHAMLTASVLPVFLHLFLGRRSGHPSIAAFLSGTGLAGLYGNLLVVLGHHSCAETAAGWFMGTATGSLLLVRLYKHTLCPPRHAALTTLVCFAIGCIAWSPTLERIIPLAALHLSGGAGIYSYKTWRLGP